MTMTCPLCGGNESLEPSKTAVSVYSTDPCELAYCGSCQHFFTSGLPDDGFLNELYKSAYSYDSHRAIAGEKRWRISRTLARLRSFLPHATLMIDVGCMDGFSLEVMRDLGFKKLLGIEINESSVKTCRDKGFEVFLGTLQEWLSCSDRPDRGPVCLLLSHVIEHIRDCGAFLDQANSFLAAGDRLIVLAPNSRSRTAGLLGRYWGWWQVPVHCHHFTAVSLRKALQSHGFSVEFESKAGADSLFWLSSLSARYGLKSRSTGLSALQGYVVKLFSSFARFWYFIGDEELIVVAGKMPRNT